MEIVPGLHQFPWESLSANNCNTYFIDGPTPVLVDPGHSAHFHHVVEGLAELGRTPDDVGLVICTHAHPDHMEAVELLRGERTRFALHAADWELAAEMARLPGGGGADRPAGLTPDFFLTEGRLNVGGIAFEVLHTPGHSPGSICIHWPDAGALLTGDLIFSQGLGRTDLPGGDGQALRHSIERLAGMDIDVMLPGHGPVLTDREAVRWNLDHIRNTWFRYI